jgi:hypothetical protein
MDRDLELMIRQATPLVFGIFSHMNDQCGNRICRLSGSGIFILPFQALTARHVCRDLNKIDPGRSDELDKRTHGYFELQHSVGLFQVPEVSGPCAPSAIWAVNRTWDPVLTDICFMEVSADSGAAVDMQFKMPARFFEWSLLPPTVGSHVVALGYPKCDIKISGESWNITRRYEMREGTVIEVFALKRDSGMYNFPCFCIDKEVDHGFSGGPVFCNGRLCGIVSGGSVPGVEITYAASLWPLCLMEYEHPDQRELGRKQPFSQLFDCGVLRSDDWPSLRGRISKQYDDQGKPFASMVA